MSLSDLIAQLDAIIAKFRYVKYGDIWLSADHNDPIDAIKKLREIVYALSQAAAPPLEGDYSDWTIYDSFDDPHASDGDYRQFAVANREETKITIFDVYGGKIKAYDIESKTLTDLGFTNPIINYGIDQYAYWSAYGTYQVVIDNHNYLKIIKNGAVIKILSYSDLGLASGTIRDASISPKGKYIVVAGVREATYNPGWVILKGS
jgi:hypothetical protein